MTDLTPTGTAQLDETSLALADNLTFDQWADVGDGIIAVTASARWWVGDWLLYAEQHYATNPDGELDSEKMAEIRRVGARKANVDLDSIRQQRRVARVFPPERRRAAVPWSLHLEVAALEADVADDLLAQAEAEGWSRRDMAAAVKRRAALDVDEAPDPPVKPLRVGWRIVVDEAHRAEVEQLVEEHRAQILKQLARRKVTATVEVA